MKLLINHRRCSNYIFILDITPGFNRLHKDNCKTRRKHSSFVIWCSLYCRFNGRYTSIAIMITLCLDIVTQFHYNPIFVKPRQRDVLRRELSEIFHEKNHPTNRSSLHSIKTIFLIFWWKMSLFIYDIRILILTHLMLRSEHFRITRYWLK